MILWGMWGILYTTCIKYFWRFILWSCYQPSLKINPHLISTLWCCTMLGRRDGNTSVVQAHFTPRSTDIRQLPIGHYRWRGTMLAVFFPAFQITIAIHQKVTLWMQRLCSFIQSPTALLFRSRLKMAAFLCQDLDDLETVSPFKEL